MKTGFYNIETLTTNKLKTFFKDAVMLSYDTHIEKLDVNVSMSRLKTNEKSVLEFINNASSKYHNVCIDRSVQLNTEKYGEIGYSVIGDNYFLYIFVTLENLEILTKKYGLEMK